MLTKALIRFYIHFFGTSMSVSFVVTPGNTTNFINKQLSALNWIQLLGEMGML